MEPADHLAHVRREADRLLDAARGDLFLPVPSCPGWDLARLVAHVGSAHAWWRMHAERGPGGERVRLREVPGPGAEDDVLEWFDAGTDAAIAALSTMDLDATWPTFLGPRPGTFHARRLAHETAIHRWDAQGAVGDPEPIDAELAADGVDELLEELASRIPGEMLDRSGTIHLHATDADAAGAEGEWLIRLDAGRGAEPGITFEHGHAKGDVAVRGTCSDLFLLVWNRVPADDRFDLFGDTTLLDTWRTKVRF